MNHKTAIPRTTPRRIVLEENGITEEWRSVPGFHGAYMVSDQGRVKRIYDPTLADFAQRPCLSRTPVASPRGTYHRVKLTYRTEIRNIAVAWLVLYTFMGPPPQRDAAPAYRDQDRTNDRLTNLYWADPATDPAALGRRRGASNHMAKIDQPTAEKIIRRSMQYQRERTTGDDPRTALEFYHAYADDLGVPWYTVRDIASRRSWLWLWDRIAPNALG